MSETTPGRNDADAGEPGDPDALPGDAVSAGGDADAEEGDLDEGAEESEAAEGADDPGGDDLVLTDETPAEPPSRKTRDRPAGTIRAAEARKTAAAAPSRTRRGGRTTPKGGQPVRATSRTGRYTHPIPRERRQSAPWYPFVLLAFLILGLLTIVLNYVNVLPGGTNNWYLIGGIVAIIVGLFMATFYH